MKTYAPKPKDIERRWYVVDVDGAVLGRVASEVAQILRGKHKPIYAPHADTGDHVIVINARGIRLTGGKEQKKVAYRHSGYPGGLKEIGYERLLSERPSYVVEKAVRGMLPKSRLGRAMARKLQVYDGPEHPHSAQKPTALALGEIPPWNGLPAPVPPAASPAGADASKPRGSSTAKRGSAARSSAPKRTTTRSTTRTTAAKPATTEKSATRKRTSAVKRTGAKRSTTSRTRSPKTKEES